MAPRPIRRSDGKESKWDVFDRFVEALQTLDFDILSQAEESQNVGDKRKILAQAGIAEAMGVTGSYLVNAVSKTHTAREGNQSPQRVSLEDLLSYGGIGRYLICYKDEDPDDGWVVKIPNSQQNLGYIDLYALNGTRMAQERLGDGLAAESLIIDGRESGRALVFYTDSGLVVSDVTIVQKKILSFVDYLKRVCRQGCKEEDVNQAITYIDRLNELILGMYRCGVVDIDTFNIVGNYGIRKNGNVTIFDLGDLSTSRRDAEEFVDGLKSFNELLFLGLLEVDGTDIDERIASHFERNQLTPDDFYKEGKLIFGLEFEKERCRMGFPHSEQEIRELLSSQVRYIRQQRKSK